MVNGQAANQKIYIFVIDGDLSHQEVIWKIAEDIPDVEIVGVASSCGVAPSKLRHTDVDLILVDMKHVMTNSFSVITDMIKKNPRMKVVAINCDERQGNPEYDKAMAMGISDFLPGISADEKQYKSLRLRFITIISPIKSQKNLHGISRSGETSAAASAGASVETVSGAKKSGLSPDGPAIKTSKLTLLLSKVDVVVIASSTGGPKSLEHVIPRLPSRLGVPVFLVQHMPPHLTQSLVKNLDQLSELSVVEAMDGVEVKPNVVYVAPGGRHMIVKNNPMIDNKKYVGLNDLPPENSVRPSADVLFRSVADVYQGNILAVVMTGMGKDGVAGVRRMKEEGCYCLSQTEASCIVYGMSRSIDEAGLSDEKVDLDHLGERITTLVNDRFPRR